MDETPPPRDRQIPDRLQPAGDPSDQMGTGSATEDATAEHRRSWELSTVHERYTLGAVLNLSVTSGRDVLARYAGTDLADPQLRLVDRICRELVAEGIRPDASTVAARAQASGLVPKSLMPTFLRCVLDLMTDVPSPISGPYYARAVVSDALRRRVQESATRLDQAAADSELGTLLTLVSTEHDDIMKMATRLANRMSGGAR